MTHAPATLPRPPGTAEPGLDYPAWVPWLTLAIAAGVASLSSVPHHGETPHPLALVLLWVSIIPWVLDAIDRPLPRLGFAAGVMIPQAVLHVGGEALGIADLSDESPIHMAAMIVVFAVGQIAATTRWRDAVVVSVAGIAILVGRTLVEPGFDAGMYWGAGTVIAFGIGFMMRRQAEIAYQLRAAQQALARDAVDQERHRIAREVHDVVAHSLTVTMMHLTAARMSAGVDADGVRTSLEEAERLGREALMDLRRTVGLLRDAPASGDEPPQPHASDIERLVEDNRAAGMDVTLEAMGELRELSGSVGLAVYRIVQESLTNARKHATGAPVQVSVTCRDGAVDVRVRNRLTEPVERDGTGLGVVGMRERAALLGGSVDAGPEGDEWRVRATIPTSPPKDAHPAPGGASR